MAVLQCGVPASDVVLPASRFICHDDWGQDPYGSPEQHQLPGAEGLSAQPSWVDFWGPESIKSLESLPYLVSPPQRWGPERWDFQLGMKHVFPVDLMHRWDWPLCMPDRDDNPNFFEHVFFGEFEFTPEQIEAVRTRGATVQTNEHEARLVRKVEIPTRTRERLRTTSGYAVGGRQLVLRTNLSVCFVLCLSEDGVVSCTCKISWNVCREQDDLHVVNDRDRWLGTYGDICERATVLAVVGDFSGLTGHRNADFDGLRFTALLGVCQIKLNNIIHINH